MHLKWRDESSLRRLAESAVAAEPISRRTIEDTGQLLYELEVHQAELEMQNEALRDAQIELSNSEQRYKDLFENAPVAYLVLTASGLIESANPRAMELFGNALLKTRLSQYLVPEEAIPFELYRREVLASPDRFTAEFAITDPRGCRREVRLDSMRTNDEGTGWRVAVTDSTTQNAVVRKLSHAERLGAVGEHASGIAHDLNNLLYSIGGHTDVAMRFLEPDDAAYDSLVQLRSVVQRCAAATEQLASFSRAEVKGPSIVDLNETIAGMEAVLRSLLGDDIELELELMASNPIVRLETAHVEQVLLSALRNARHAMPHGGKFRVETASVTLRGRPQEGSVESIRYVRWTMSDTGFGMTEATRRQAFDPFFTTKPAGAGTGLGLSLVNSVVERAGGAALLESELARGTSLVIDLPCASASSSLSSRPAPPSHQPSMTVMVVEDIPEIRARIATRLRNAGCDVVQAGNGGEALDQLKKIVNRVAVILVDEGLPGEVENEFLWAIRALAPFVEVIVTSLSANELDARRLNGAIEAAADRVLTAVARLNQ